ncbi:hypothetical protein [Aeromicrobium ginsengisoli]|uniref:Uncharacterized protein n=1 Tax=Aeromicrobium ginsengisoli TaxID=363867 RepID=A0A5M4FIS1_9ACTN|nr:hypothetical protein [Aeromicrobium ginsengisoli]KAA1400076.1 hypothetical protein ESP70_004865 [Aeromicrobium ginsengisoli]
MSLEEMLDHLLEPHAVDTDDEGDRLVALRLADDWGVGVRLHRRGTHRQWNVREVTLRLLDPDSGISGNDVRELPLGSLLSEAKRLATKDSLSASPTPRVSLADLLEQSGGAFGSGDDALAALALEYVSLVESGVRTPSKALAERFGGAAGTWTNRVAQSRKRGFLTPVDRGEAGGALTPKALSALGLRRD